MVISSIELSWANTVCGQNGFGTDGLKAFFETDELNEAGSSIEKNKNGNSFVPESKIKATTS
jgi:hypothetical protein